jgi:hypothetical protein
LLWSEELASSSLQFTLLLFTASYAFVIPSPLERYRVHKSKKEKKDKEDDSPKKPIYSSAMAEEFLDRVKTGRPVTLQKAIARVEKDMGDKFNSEEVFSTLRLKREKDGNITVSVASVKERKKSKDE